MKEGIKSILSLLAVLITLLAAILTVSSNYRDAISIWSSFEIGRLGYFIISIISLFFLVVFLPEKIKIKTVLFTEKNKNYIPLFTFVNLLVAISIVGLSLKSIEEIENVSRHNSTYYIGNFPENIHAINKFLKDDPPKNSLKIVNDYIDYGIYSENEEYKVYFKLLKDFAIENNPKDEKENQIEFRIKVYGDSIQQEETEHQVFKLDWEKEILTSKFLSFKEEYYKNKNDLTKEYLANTLLRIEKEDQEILLKNNVLTLSKNYYNFFCWIKDGKEAIFCFHRNTLEDQSEETFYTNDQSYVNELVKIYNEVE